MPEPISTYGIVCNKIMPSKDLKAPSDVYKEHEIYETFLDPDRSHLESTQQSGLA